MKKRKAVDPLRVSGGIEQQSTVNRSAIENLRKYRKNTEDPKNLYEAILSGNRTALSRAITLIESSLPDHQQLAQEIIQRLLPHSGNSLRLGITGVPGAGKSTFIESLGNYLVNLGHRIAVLAIDPSSARSGGSILGDKTRMETLAASDKAFIRPSPAGGTLGGVARKTRESIILFEAAGYDTIIVETIGVGQSETTVHSMVDFFLLLMIPGAGDELQGMKRGIMELADSIVINKADGENLQRAERSKTEYSNALHLFPLPPSGWEPRVTTCSALENLGINTVWDMVLEYRKFTTSNGYWNQRRAEQSYFWMFQSIDEGLKQKFFSNPDTAKKLEEMKRKISAGEISSFSAASELLEFFTSRS